MSKEYEIREANGSVEQVDLCSEWDQYANNAVGWAYILQNAFGLLIVIVSFITRKLFVWIISKIKQRRLTQ